MIDYLASHWQGIVVAILVAFAALMLVQWLAWIFRWGRFGAEARRERRDTLRFVFADLLVKIIDDFRHLLALVVILIFAAAMAFGFVLVAYETDGRMVALADVLQAVVSALGGLIGAIIGYYFGEKAGERRSAESPPAAGGTTPAGPAAQGPPPDGGDDRTPGIRPAPRPPTEPRRHDE